mmetsp:Transcript_29142/g.61338  ORF Transcript_29142/g.61338 Transcript_29142/m.61338 type:complete len:320 (+) Transcript_29142:145-1104(+)|eukprot:CAMPEP_0171330072 /NCGR_PEP_ID=MMETSP0878-20121228/1742_1 /TAXON_ID=67004 /ORGANISM="Thalassiosira weissflogii, Strain CCMP1336" /LENGTH=319 /DNA_ID=CAMNT_0011830269 /DNA_START=70 /DNA_END=1029 /DNA_ORIENTATION=-
MADNAASSSLAAESSVVDRRRLSTWALLALFSALCLTAHETDDQNTKNKQNKWITACTSVSVAFSFLSVVAHVGGNALGSMFVGTIAEGIAALILVGMWAGCLPVVMDPSYGLGQMYVGKSAYGAETADYQATISNANLYFTAWGCGVCALTVLAMYVRERLGGGVTGGGMGYTAKWYLLMLASVVVIIESMRFKKDVCAIEGGTEDVTCARNTYGLITGCIGLAISFFISLFSSLGKDSALITTASSFLMAALYTVCAGLLTFENGPATYVGNHYFSAWAGFFISFAVFGSVLKEFLGVGGQQTTTSSGVDDVEMNNI